jgi:hypothetical protein
MLFGIKYNEHIKNFHTY